MCLFFILILYKKAIHTFGAAWGLVNSFFNQNTQAWICGLIKIKNCVSDPLERRLNWDPVLRLDENVTYRGHFLQVGLWGGGGEGAAGTEGWRAAHAGHALWIGNIKNLETQPQHSLQTPDCLHVPIYTHMIN